MTTPIRPAGVRLALVVGLCGLVACGSDSGADATTTTTGSIVATTSARSAPPNTSAATSAPTTTATTSAPGTSAATTSVVPSTTRAPSTTSATPVPGPNVYLAYTDTGNVTARSGGQVLGEAGCGECALTAATYRDGVIWIATFSDAAEVTRHDLASGNTTSVYRADPGVQIKDIAVWDSSLWIVTSRDDPAAGSVSALIAVDAGGARHIEGSVLGVAASPDGRYLAYATCGPCAADGARHLHGAVVVVADLTSGAKREIPQTDGAQGGYLAPDPLSWTSDGTLLIDETWEGNRTSVLAFAATTQADAVALDGEAACFVDDTHVAVARWNHPYAEGLPESGPIVVRTLTSPDETPYGSAAVIGTSMACDTDGAVVVATDDGRLVRITPDGATTELGVGYARVTPA